MATMIAVDSERLDRIELALMGASKALEEARNREEQLRKQADADTLLSEEQACVYLNRTSAELQYYRRKKLPFFKKGADVWYRKGDIDSWLAGGYVNRHQR